MICIPHHTPNKTWFVQLLQHAPTELAAVLLMMWAPMLKSCSHLNELGVQAPSTQMGKHTRLRPRCLHHCTSP